MSKRRTKTEAEILSQKPQIPQNDPAAELEAELLGIDEFTPGPPETAEFEPEKKTEELQFEDGSTKMVTKSQAKMVEALPEELPTETLATAVASQIEPPPYQLPSDESPKESSSPELQEHLDPNTLVGDIADGLREYCRAPGAVALVCKVICERVPEAMPNYNNWAVPDIMPFVISRINSPGYVEAVIPSLLMMMGDNIKNTRWAGQVLVGLTLNLLALELPAIMAGSKPAPQPEAAPKIFVPEQPEQPDGKIIVPVAD